MQKPITRYWQKRLSDVRVALEKNNFEVFLANDITEAKNIVQVEILPGLDVDSVSWGGSMTFVKTGLYDFFVNNSGYKVIDTYDKTIDREQMMARRRQALLVDLFFTGTNAVTENGQLVNLDMQGNRVAAITHGPRHVVILVGRNKITHTLEDAFFRIKHYAAPVNALRLDMNTPYVKTAVCEECASPDRICNSWVITEKSYPKGRTRVVLIDDDLGL